MVVQVRQARGCIDAEVLAGECRHENAAQRFTPAPFWSHAGAQVRATLPFGPMEPPRS